MNSYYVDNWESNCDSWYSETYSHYPSLFIITCEDFFNDSGIFFFPYHYDVNLIFNI